MSNAPVDQTADVAEAHAATAPAGALTGKVGKSSALQSIPRTPSENFALVLASLQRGPKTRKALALELRSAANTISRCLNAMHTHGTVYIAQRVGTRTKTIEVFALNPKPFHFEDVPRASRTCKGGV